MMNETCSLGELASWFSKAARCSGIPWGHMDEAGWCARYLADHGLPGPQLLLAYLRSRKDENGGFGSPETGQFPWRPSSEKLCPIITAAALTDRDDMLGKPEIKRLENVAYPLLIVAQLALWVEKSSIPLQLQWPGADIVILKKGLCIGHQANLTTDLAREVVLLQSESLIATHLPRSRHVNLDAQAWAEVQAMAFQTFVPPTELSRDGAGAGLLDND